jgi:hypothetical protein
LNILLGLISIEILHIKLSFFWGSLIYLES